MKTKRKFLSLLLALCMVLTLVPMTAFAAENAVDTWDGTADISWYEGNEDAFEYHITTAEQLAGFSALTNQASPITFVGKTVYLDADVDLDGYTWTAVSENGHNSTATSFAGTFDGQGHIIHNLNGSSPSQRLGLFGAVYNATIKNINLDNATITASPDSKRLQYGTLISWAASSTVKNCYASGKVDVAVDELIGGLIGQCTGNARVIGCGVSVDVVSTYPQGDIGDPAPTVGGVVGQFENAGEDSLISDCYFSGSISVTSNQAGCGGIFGACFDFDGAPGLTISNCVLFTEDITCGNPDNITYIAAVDEDATVQHCFWPDGDRAAVVRLVVDWDLGIAAADPEFDQGVCGESVSDFFSAGLMEKLNKNAYSGVTWTQGKDGYPVFSWQDNLISADYSLVDAVVEKANNLDKELYSNYGAVTTAIEAVDRTKSKAEQAAVDAMAKAIGDAIAALEYKGADYNKVDKAIAKANALKKDEYKDFSAVEAAISAVVRDKNITEQAVVDAMVKAIGDAITALEYKDADYSKVDEAIAKANALKKDEYKDFSAVEAAISAVVRDKNITEQAVVDAMVKAIEDAIAALEYKGADYTKVDEAIAKSKALSPDDYTNFLAVEAAISAVVRGKDITEQDEVDDMALAIENAIANLEKKSEMGAPSDTDTPTGGGQTGNTTSPETGDNSNIAFWIATMLAAGIVLADTVLYNRKKKYSK